MKLLSHEVSSYMNVRPSVQTSSVTIKTLKIFKEMGKPLKKIIKRIYKMNLRCSNFRSVCQKYLYNTLQAS